MINYEELESKEAEIRNDNELLIAEFEKWLVSQNISMKTVKKHVENVDFYINDFLNYYEPTKPEEGVYLIDNFLGDWFIRKAVWSNKSSILSNITSLKKFYKFMLKKGLIEKEEFKIVDDTIKNSKNDWIERVERYNNSN